MENKKTLINKVVGLITIVLLATGARLIPHPPNFTPVGGLALFSGASLNGTLAFILPLFVIFLSDLFLGFHSSMIYVYISFSLTVLLGRVLKKNQKLHRLVLTSLSSSLLFFLVTNFGFWVSTNIYPKSFSGLLNCYFMGLPFFRNTLVGDLFYTLSFFYGYKYLVLKFWAWATGTLWKSATVPQR